jgi:hypothetical protein
MFSVPLRVIGFLICSGVPLFFLFSTYYFKQAGAELHRVDGSCKAIGQPILGLVDGACVLSGKVLFTAGEHVASVATIKGDCDRYGWLFRLDEDIACTWTETDDIDRIHSWWHVSFNWWHVDGLRAIVMLFLWSVRFTIASTAASLWAGFLFLAWFGPRDLIVWIWNSMMYSPYWLWIDSTLALVVVGFVVYWYGYRMRVHPLPGPQGVEQEEIASTTLPAQRKSPSPPSATKQAEMPDKLTWDGKQISPIADSVLFNRQGKPIGDQ